MRFLRDLWGSATSFRFYHRAMQRRLTAPLLYFLLFTLLFSLAESAWGGFQIGQVVYQGADDYWRTTPDFELRINHGVVSTNLPEPYYFSRTPDTAIIVDTTGAVTNLDGYRQGVLLTRDRLIYKRNAYEVREYELSELDGLYVNRQMVGDFIEQWKGWFVLGVWLIIFLLLMLWYGVGRFTYVVLLSLAGWGLNALLKKELGFDQVLAAGLYAVTLPAIGEKLLRLLPCNVPFDFTLIYLVFLLGAILTVSPPEVSAPAVPVESQEGTM